MDDMDGNEELGVLLRSFPHQPTKVTEPMALTSPQLRDNPRLQQAAATDPPLQKGDKGEAVALLQHCLVSLGLSLPRSTRHSGIPDGIFGDETDSAVKAFQKQNGLKVDGKAGPKTLRRVDDLMSLLEKAQRAKLVAETAVPAPIGKWYVS